MRYAFFLIFAEVFKLASFPAVLLKEGMVLAMVCQLLDSVCEVGRVVPVYDAFGDYF